MLGIIFKVFGGLTHQRFSILTYLGMGWMAVFAIRRFGSMSSSPGCSGFLPEVSLIPRACSSTQQNGFPTTTSSGIFLSLPAHPAIFARSCGMQDI